SARDRHTEGMGPAAALVTILFSLSSPAFGNGGLMPARYTCDGADTSPPLRWTAPPRGTRSFSISVTDVDANVFIHWSATGIAPSVRPIPAGVHLRHQGLH